MTTTCATLIKDLRYKGVTQRCLILIQLPANKSFTRYLFFMYLTEVLLSASLCHSLVLAPLYSALPV